MANGRTLHSRLAILDPRWFAPDGDESREAREIRLQQVLVLSKQTPWIAAGNILNSALTVFIFWDLAPHATLLAWAGLTWAAAGARLRRWQRYRGRAAPARVSRRPIDRSLLWAGLSGGLWGLCALLFFDPDSIVHQMFLAFVIGGMGAAAAATLWAHPLAGAAFIVPSTLSLVFEFAIQGDKLSVVFAAIGALYCLVLLQILRNGHRGFIDSVRVRIDNEALIDKLEVEAAEREAVNRRLIEEIAERRRVEEDLRTSQRYLAEGQRVARLGSYDWQVQSGEVRRSDELYRILGVEPEAGDPASKAWRSYVHPDDRALVCATIREALDPETQANTFLVEYRTAPCAGKERYLLDQGEVTFDSRGRPLRVLGTILDISEQKRREQALRESEERFRNLIEGSIEGIIITDGEHRPLFVNQSWAELHDYNVDEVMSLESLVPLIAPHDRQRLIGYRDARMRGAPAPARYTFQGLRKDGSLTWFENLARVVTWQGQPAIQCTIIDITEQKQAEERYRALFENTPISIREMDLSRVKARIDGLGIEDPDAFIAYLDDHPDFVAECARLMDVVDANQACLKLHDVADKNEFLATFPRTFSEEALGNLKRTLQAIHKGEPQREFETCVVRADGTRREVMARWMVAAGHEGDYSRVLFSSVDVTERKQAEEALRASEERFRALVEAGSDWLWEMDERLRFSFVSEEMSKRWGVREEYVLGKTRWELAGADPERDELWRRHRDDLEARRPFRDFRYSLIDPNGRKQYRRVTGSPVFDEAGRFKGYRGTATSETAEVAARERAEEAEARFRNLIEGSIEGVLVHRDFEPLFVNEAWAELHGYTTDEILRMDSVLELVAPHDRLRLEGYGQARLRGEEVPSRYTYQGVKKDGTLTWFEHLVRVVLWDGEPAIQGTIIDITEQKLAEERARRHEAELAQVLRFSTMGEMASSLAHQLNQPLAAVVNYARGSRRRLRSGTWKSDELIEVMEQACEQAERASSIVSGIAEFIRDSAKNKSLVRINDVIGSALTLAEAELRDGRVRIRVDLEREAPPVPVNVIEMEQAILNLVRNGVEAMADTAAAKRQLTVRTQLAGDDQIEVAIEDTGPGLSPDTEHKVFEPFFSTKPRGMGMGLPISRTIVEAHGGRLWATDNPHGGATFHFTLLTNGNAVDGSG